MCESFLVVTKIMKLLCSDFLNSFVICETFGNQLKVIFVARKLLLSFSKGTPLIDDISFFDLMN